MMENMYLIKLFLGIWKHFLPKAWVWQYDQRQNFFSMKAFINKKNVLVKRNKMSLLCNRYRWNILFGSNLFQIHRRNKYCFIIYRHVIKIFLALNNFSSKKKNSINKIKWSMKIQMIPVSQLFVNRFSRNRPV